jgi:hypothetical protein
MNVPGPAWRTLHAPAIPLRNDNSAEEFLLFLCTAARLLHEHDFGGQLASRQVHTTA